MNNHVFLVPTKNEEKAIRFVLGRIRDKFPSQKIIVVDGHSTDNTLKIAREFRGVEILEQKSQGKGGGILEALATLPANTRVIMLDGDGSYDLSDVNVLLKDKPAEATLIRLKERWLLYGPCWDIKSAYSLSKSNSPRQQKLKS